MMVVAVETEFAFDAGTPEFLFAAPYRRGGPLRTRPWDVAPDGRFLMVREGPVGQVVNPHIVMVQNWLEELTERVPIP